MRKVVAVIFALLLAAFAVRGLQYGYRWLTHAPSSEANFKALTLWCLVYVVVCAGIATVSFRLNDGPNKESRRHFGVRDECRER